MEDGHGFLSDHLSKLTQFWRPILETSSERATLEDFRKTATEQPLLLNFRLEPDRPSCGPLTQRRPVVESEPTPSSFSPPPRIVPAVQVQQVQTLCGHSEAVDCDLQTPLSADRTTPSCRQDHAKFDCVVDRIRRLRRCARRVERLGIHERWLALAAVFVRMRIANTPAEAHDLWFSLLQGPPGGPVAKGIPDVPEVSSSGGAEEFSDRVARGGSVATVPVATALSEVLHRLGLALLATVEGLYRSSALAPALLMELRLKMMQLYGVTLVGVGQQKARLDADIEGSPYKLMQGNEDSGSGSEDEASENSFVFRSPNWLASAALGNGKLRTCFMPASPTASAFSALQFGIPGRSAAVVTDKPFRSSELSPAQIEAEDSPHAPNAAARFFPTLENFFGPQPKHESTKCIDLLGATWAMNPSKPGDGSMWYG